MDPMLLWGLIGAVAVLAISALIVVIVSFAGMKRLSASVDARWEALSGTLDNRGSAVDALLQSTAGLREQVEQALTLVEQSTSPGGKAKAEAEAQRALRPLMQAAAAEPVGSDAYEARSVVAALDEDTQQKRRDYNTGARELNAKARRFPTSLWAKTARAPRDFFEVDQSGAVAEPPRVQF